MQPNPFFSIVVPMYNRESVIVRALRSCVTQEFDNFEVLVVDDGSTDNSVATANTIHDPRIRVIRHDLNRGVGPARNTGVELARGEWVVCLDSDDELLPGALQAIFRRAIEVKENVCGLRFACRLSNGRISPDPPLVEMYWNHETYLRWIEATRMGLQETMPVARRKTFNVVRYPNDRALETTYHLEFSRNFVTQVCPEIVRLYHMDAHNQLTNPNIAQMLKGARDQAKSIEYIIAKYGTAMESWAPTVLRDQLAGVITLHFLAGNRKSGLVALWRMASRFGVSKKAIAAGSLGMIDRRLLALAKMHRVRQFRSHR